MSQRIPLVVPKNSFVTRDKIKVNPDNCPICGSKLDNDKCGCDEYGWNAEHRAHFRKLETEILAEYDAANPNVPNVYVEWPNYMTNEKFILLNVLLEQLDYSNEGVALAPRRKGNEIIIPNFQQFVLPTMFRVNIPEWEEFYEAQASQGQDPQATAGNLPQGRAGSG